MNPLASEPELIRRKQKLRFIVVILSTLFMAIFVGGLGYNFVTSGSKLLAQGTSNPTSTPGEPHTEQEGALGSVTYSNPYTLSGTGPSIPPGTLVQVSCKVFAPTVPSVSPDGYWYRIASSPWNNTYFAAANTFLNGDILGQRPYTHNTDFNVPDC